MNKIGKSQSRLKTLGITVGAFALFFILVSILGSIFSTQEKTYCGDNICSADENCNTCPADCGQCALPSPDSTGNSFQAYNDKEPYYSDYCDKIDPYDLNIRKASAAAIRNDSGLYSVNQLFDIYDWVKSNIAYQNVALAGTPYYPQETLATQSGDCKNQAVLIASMVEAIGGRAKVVIDSACAHAYTIVHFGSAGEDLSTFSQAVANHYGRTVQINTITNEDGVWVIFDPAGGEYPGNTLPACSGNRTVYFVDSCLSCAQNYPNMPFNFDDKCYSACPSGTAVSANKYVCISNALNS